MSVWVLESLRRAVLAGPRVAVLAILLLPPGVAGATPLRVVTLNVWSGLDYRGNLKMGEYEDRETRTRRTEILVAELRRLDPDVIAINEANKLPRYARRLARELGYDRVWHVGVGGLRAGPVGLPVNLREGDVILARPELELERGGRKQLSGGPVGNFFTAHFSDATQVVGARIHFAGREVWLFDTHWHASPFPTEAYLGTLERQRDAGTLDEKQYAERVAAAVDGAQWRMDEARKTLAFIDRRAGTAPVILMGDFNTLASNPEIAALRDAGFVDAFDAAGSGPGFTWDEENNPNIQLQRLTEPAEIPGQVERRRIDFIFARGSGATVTRAEVVLDQPVEGLLPSDHFGVLAEIDIDRGTGEATLDRETSAVTPASTAGSTRPPVHAR